MKKEFTTSWKCFSGETKRNIFYQNCKTIEELRHNLAYKDIKIIEKELEHEIEEMNKENKDQFYHHIFRTTFADLNHPFTDYQRLIYASWKKEIEQNSRKKPIKSREERDYNSEHKSEQKIQRSRKNKKQKSISLESN